MSDKTAKKLRQLFKRDIRDQYLLIKNVVRPKPRLVPKWLWKILWRIIIKDIQFPS